MHSGEKDGAVQSFDRLADVVQPDHKTNAVPCFTQHCAALARRTQRREAEGCASFDTCWMPYFSNQARALIRQRTKPHNDRVVCRNDPLILRAQYSVASAAFSPSVPRTLHHTYICVAWPSLTNERTCLFVRGSVNLVTRHAAT